MNCPKGNGGWGLREPRCVLGAAQVAVRGRFVLSPESADPESCATGGKSGAPLAKTGWAGSSTA